MQFSTVEIRFIVTIYLYSTFANDLKRKYFFFSKNVRSNRVCSFKFSIDFFRMRKIMFKTDKNQSGFSFSKDHNDIFDHKYHIDQGNLLAFNIAC